MSLANAACCHSVLLLYPFGRLDGVSGLSLPIRRPKHRQNNFFLHKEDGCGGSFIQARINQNTALSANTVERMM